jgi:peptidoglycan hydrolase-like protein with peptidoglycan-binding domain
MQYTNAQFRSILCGLGYLGKEFVSDGNSSSFPVTSDNSSLTGTHTRYAITQFQQEYKIQADGLVGPQTMGKAEQVMKILQNELNQCAKTGLPNNQPFYGPLTTAAVKKFQAKIGVKQDGIARSSLRLKLYELYRTGACSV